MGGPQGQSGQVRKISPPPGFDPRTVQPVGSRYTDYAARPTVLLYNHGGNSFRHDERRAVILYIKLVAWEWNFRRTELVPLTVWQWFRHCGSRTPRSVDISNRIFTLDVSCMVQTGWVGLSPRGPG